MYMRYNFVYNIFYMWAIHQRIMFERFYVTSGERSLFMLLFLSPPQWAATAAVRRG